MGSLHLECPLCCNETFPTTTALKYHLLNMLDNLLCTGCGSKFSDVRVLAEHMAQECAVNSSESADEAEDNQGSLLEKALTEKKADEGEKSTEEGEAENREPGFEGENMEVEEETVTVKIEPDDGEVQAGDAEVQGGGDDLFYCSSCNFSFQDVDTHLNEFHSGQEVFVEDGTQEQEEAVQEKNEEDMQLLQTIQEEECTDKAGRKYTRKVVQIGKFWDTEKSQAATARGSGESNGEEKQPILHFYNVKEDGLAEKIEADDLMVHKDEIKNLLQVFQCPDCNDRFTDKRLFNWHRCGPSSLKYKCGVCGSVFALRRSLNAHMRSHVKNAKSGKTAGGKQSMPPTPSSADGDTEGETHEPYVCEFCSTPFNSYKSLRLHVRMHEPIKSKEVEPPVNYGIMGEDIEVPTSERVMFTCTVCNKEYDEVYRHVHMNSHSQEENYDCDTCNRKFYTQSNLEMHMRVHANCKTHTCSYCKREFDEYKDLQEHIKEHLESRPYQCQYCTRRFIRPHEKVKHERIHTGEKPHVCEVCGKAFRVSYCLTLHMRTHSGTRPYQCQECGKRFKAHSVYNHHLLIHSNVRKYKCPYCPKAFKTAVQLAGHKNTHTKPFTCTECNRPFASLYAVRSHMETHKTENNLKYNCLTCGASYARAFALRDHIKAHHGAEQWDEELDSLQENSSAATTIMNDGAIQNVLILDQETLVDTVDMIEEPSMDDN